LNAFTIYLPPLRERREDIGLLVEHFLKLNAGNEGRNLKFLRSSMDILLAYDWPGNVRELKGVVDYAVNMSTGSIIDPGALPNFLFASDAIYEGGPESSPVINNISGNRTLASILRQVEKDLIKDALEKSGSKTEAIKKLGISRRSFYLKIREYGLI
jgi:transcriptional regulator with PAS, ATPase and Fis domain